MTFLLIQPIHKHVVKSLRYGIIFHDQFITNLLLSVKEFWKLVISLFTEFMKFGGLFLRTHPSEHILRIFLDSTNDKAERGLGDGVQGVADPGIEFGRGI